MRQILLLITIVNTVYAQRFPDPNIDANLNCSKDSKYKVDLKNDVFGSLRFSQGQDQSGFGTCYANAASLMLESYLGHPVSYHQLAMQGQASSIQDKKTGPKSLFKRIKVKGVEKQDFINNGGKVCDTINNAVKDKLKVCDRKYVALENLAPQDSSTQMILESLAKFYDQNMNQKPGVKRALKAAAQKVKRSKYPACSNKDKLKENALGSIQSFLTPLVLKIKKSCDLTTEIEKRKKCLKFLHNIGKVKASDVERNGFIVDTKLEVEFTPKVTEKALAFLEKIKGNSFKTRDDKVKLKGSIVDGVLSEIVDESIDNIGGESWIKDSFLDNFKSSTLPYLCEEALGISAPFPGATFSESKIKSCREKQKRTLGQILIDETKDLDRDQIIALTSHSDPKRCKAYERLKIYEETAKSMCSSDSSFPKFMQEISSVSHHFFGSPEFIDTIIDSLNSNGSITGTLQRLIGKECFEKGKELPKTNFKCNEIHPFPNVTLSPSHISQGYCAEKGKVDTCLSFKCKTKEECEKVSKNINTINMRNILHKQLNKSTPSGLKGYPVSFSMCTGVLKEKDFNANYGNPRVTWEQCADSGKHGMHAMTVVGMRCKNGKVQYKIQNSWGDKKDYLNPDIEAVRGEGSFWMNEDDFINNTKDIQGINLEGSNSITY